MTRPMPAECLSEFARKPEWKQQYSNGSRFIRRSRKSSVAHNLIEKGSCAPWPATCASGTTPQEAIQPGTYSTASGGYRSWVMAYITLPVKSWSDGRMDRTYSFESSRFPAGYTVLKLSRSQPIIPGPAAEPVEG